METMEFNLLQERWVRVRTQDCTVQEVSLTDALLHAHAYVDLAGEMPTQDAAMLRLQLAVLHTVFSRVDGNGVPAPFEETEDALLRWSELWQLGHFPEQPIRDYLDKWQDRFWLFHPERPFWQVPEAKIGSPFGAKKLNGEVFESENKSSLFSACAGTGKESMDYPQAARWLVSLNNYDDAAAKKKAKDRPLPSMGPGWLGRIGVIYVKGSNLFETLMRNLMFLQDGGELWEPDVPCWELEDARSGERTEVACPDNFAELMTMQFRRALLERKENKVVGYTVLGGDFFDSTNAFAEPMTLWNKKEDKKTGLVYYDPRKHEMGKQLWREFSAISDRGGHKPGVIWWNTYLQGRKLLSRKEILQVCAVGVEYGAQSASMKDCYTDALSMNLELLNELGRTWQICVDDEVNNCEQAARIVWHKTWPLRQGTRTTPVPKPPARSSILRSISRSGGGCKALTRRRMNRSRRRSSGRSRHTGLRQNWADRWWSRRGPLHSSGIAFRIKRIGKRVICIQRPRPTTAFCMICGSCTRNRMKEGQNENQ